VRRFSDRPKRYLAWYKYVFPQQKLWAWEPKDEWLARYMGVGREVMERFDDPKNWEKGPCVVIGRPGPCGCDEDEMMGAGWLEHQFNYRGGGCGFIECYERSRLDVSRVSDMEGIFTLPDVRRIRLRLEHFRIGDSRVPVYVREGIAGRRAMLRVAAVLEEQGVVGIIEDDRTGYPIQVPIDHFL
jgi:hypothetical protein